MSERAVQLPRFDKLSASGTMAIGLNVFPLTLSLSKGEKELFDRLG